jgi:hypothetical protein
MTASLWWWCGVWVLNYTFYNPKNIIKTKNMRMYTHLSDTRTYQVSLATLVTTTLLTTSSTGLRRHAIAHLFACVCIVIDFIIITK